MPKQQKVFKPSVEPFDESPTRVKICGITNVEDMLLACLSGADAIGLVFYAPSKRHVDIDQAVLIAEHLPPFVQLVGLFVDASKDYIDRVLSAVPLQMIQFHGDETEHFCQSFKCNYIKAIPMKPGIIPSELMNQYPSAQGFLLDTFIPGQPGGTGQTFDWGLFPDYHKPLILAGGLDADNVKVAIETVKPYAVDISGGVELSPGKKSAGKLQAFIANAKRAYH
jgi:phosphoribosylanthranilate isomerase